VHVRRGNVFEESFQALRYKSAAEMRRKLAIEFHNEEGEQTRLRYPEGLVVYCGDAQEWMRAA